MATYVFAKLPHTPIEWPFYMVRADNSDNVDNNKAEVLCCDGR